MLWRGAPESQGVGQHGHAVFPCWLGLFGCVGLGLGGMGWVGWSFQLGASSWGWRATIFNVTDSCTRTPGHYMAHAQPAEAPARTGISNMGQPRVSNGTLTQTCVGSGGSWAALLQLGMRGTKCRLSRLAFPGECSQHHPCLSCSTLS